MKIISGGQTGADRAGLDFAIEHNIEHGGFCPKGRRSEDGSIPAKYNLAETSSRNYLARTELNVIHSDATIIFMKPGISSPGSIRTEQFCRVNGKPYLILEIASNNAGNIDDINHDTKLLVNWLEQVEPQTLNVAGHRESSYPGIHSYVYEVFKTAQLRCALLK